MSAHGSGDGHAVSAHGSEVRRERRRRDDAGFTALEMLVTVSMLSLVIGVLFMTLWAVLRNERQQQARATNQEVVRLTLIEVGQDLRAADPLIQQDTVTDYERVAEVQFVDAAGADRVVRWRHEIADDGVGQLVHEVLDEPGGSVLSTRTLLHGLVDNDEAGTPVFRYYDESGNQLTSATATAEDVANCAIRVTVTVTNVEDDAAAAFSSEIDVHLRNRLPGGAYGCTEV